MPTKSEDIEKIKAALSPEQQAELLGEGGGWQPPIPFDEAKLPSFPVERFPQVLRDYVQQVAQSIQVPVDMAAVAALCVLAVCCQGKYVIQGKPGYLEPLNLYGLIIANPGERKSAVLREVKRPVLEWEQEQNEQLTQSVATSKSQKNILEKQLRAAEERAAKRPDDKDAYNDAQDLAIQLAEYQEVNHIRLMADDATQEALTTLMYRNHGVMSVLSAEGGIFDMMRGKYSGVSDIDLFLKAHAGDDVTVDRKGRATEYIRNPALTMLLFAQPNVLCGLMEETGFRGKGLHARFLYCLPLSMVGKRQYETPQIDAGTSAAYRETVRNMLDVPYRDMPVVLKLDDGAQGLVRAMFYFAEKQMLDELDSMTDWGSKLTGAALRIAGVMHVAGYGKDADSVPVSVTTMENANRIAMYFLEHAKAAYGMMGANQTEEDAKYLLKRILNTGKDEISKRDLWQTCKGKFKKVEEMEPALQMLIDMGYVAEATQNTGGRPSVKIIVNPYTKIPKSTKRVSQL